MANAVPSSTPESLIMSVADAPNSRSLSKMALNSVRIAMLRAFFQQDVSSSCIARFYGDLQSSTLEEGTPNQTPLRNRIKVCLKLVKESNSVCIIHVGRAL
ncbi:hypothetical protein ColLi_11174 [Colletotrichum liriopes]|uniref:Uncharacterized protein n=1 Tax=Colletotrichum liriopes TaxID=708192 RepID=A0AA37GW40_9PEZI|nr:hypothetical protein ColLi_11174 [Colletotrichum liriopes]